MNGNVKLNNHKELFHKLIGGNMETLDRMIAYEQGSLSDKETTDLFAELLKNGTAWQLQGSYGRMAMSLIKAGYLTHEGEKGENYEW
jgi:hypothetical protein